MRDLRIISIAILLFFTASGLNAQKLLLNQDYLDQFPSIERVRTAEKGTDEVDSYARFMAALDVINDMMLRDLLQAPNGGYYNMPPDADRVHARYGNAITKFTIDSPEPPSKDPRYRPLRDKYEADPAFRDSLLQTFFTPQFRTDYYAWTRKPMPAGAATRPASAPATPDADIAKATAAKVDVTLFGKAIKMGSPLGLPRCTYEDMLGVPVIKGEVDCIDVQPPATGLAGILFGSIISAGSQTATDPDVKYVHLAFAHRPTWMSGDGVWVRLNGNGGLERVVITTQGRDVEAKAAEELKGKYGTSVFSQEGTITPDVGNAFKVHDLDWALPGLHVEYRVINADDNGRVEINGTGYVRVETASAYATRTASEKKKKEDRKVL